MDHAPTKTVILDGIFGSHLRWEHLRSRLEKQVGPSLIWQYRNSGRVGLDTLGAMLGEYLLAQNEPVNLVGYSMGGLVVREALRSHPELLVRRVALVCSPNSGSLAAWLLPFKAAQQMRPGSAFLKRLDSVDWQPPTLAIWCPGDLMVLPAHSAKWAKAQEVYSYGVPAHAWPIYSPSIHRKITDFFIQ